MPTTTPRLLRYNGYWHLPGTDSGPHTATACGLDGSEVDHEQITGDALSCAFCVATESALGEHVQTMAGTRYANGTEDLRYCFERGDVWRYADGDMRVTPV